MVAESKYSQLAGHQLLRPREVPPVGTPTIQGGAYISNSRSFQDKALGSFFRGDQGLNNGPTKFTPSRSPQFSRSLTHSVRGGEEAEVVARAPPIQVDPIALPLQGQLLGLCQGHSKRKRAHDSNLCQVLQAEHRSL
jgi:hypothetical protein